MGRIDHDLAHQGWLRCVQPPPTLAPAAIPKRMVREYLSDMLQAANASIWPARSACSCDEDQVRTEYRSLSNPRDRIVLSEKCTKDNVVRQTVSIEAGKLTLVVMMTVTRDGDGVGAYEMAVTTNLFNHTVLFHDKRPRGWASMSLSADVPGAIQDAIDLFNLAFSCDQVWTKMSTH